MLNTIYLLLCQVCKWELIFLPIYMIIRMVIIKTIYRKKYAFDRKNELFQLFFYAYLIVILSVTVLPGIMGKMEFYYPEGTFGLRKITRESLIGMLTPGNIFWNLGDSFQYRGGRAFWISIMGNILLFLPLGFLFSLRYNRSVKTNLIVGGGISFLIEVFQLFLPRATDLDDVILNVLGMLLGCVLLRIAARIRGKFEKGLSES